MIKTPNSPHLWGWGWLGNYRCWSSRPHDLANRPTPTWLALSEDLPLLAFPAPDGAEAWAAPLLSRPNARSCQSASIGVGGERDRISAVSEGLIRLTLVLAIQSFLRPPSESCHQWSRSGAICARGDNDLECAFPAGPVPVSSFLRFSPDRPLHMRLMPRADGGFSLSLLRRDQAAFPACTPGYSHHNSAKYATSKLWQARGSNASKSDGDGGPARRSLRVRCSG